MLSYSELIQYAENHKDMIIQATTENVKDNKSLWLVDNGKIGPKIKLRRWDEEITGRAICFGSYPLSEKNFHALIIWEKEKLTHGKCDALYESKAYPNA